MSDFSAQQMGSIQYAAELIRQSKNTVVLTGAGISTPSGIPDFRSEGSGLWSAADPMEVASLNTFRYNPERFYEWVRPLAGCILEAQPNPAHLALVWLEEAGLIQTVITQNIDGLHQKAGSSKVLEMHGTFETMTCLQCFRRFPGLGFVEAFVREGSHPQCPICQGILKPDIILFGEQLTSQTISAARTAARTCDLMLVAGSSLEVMPVAELPLQALDQGAHLVIFNHTPTYLGMRADVVVLGNLAEVMPAVVKRVLDEQKRKPSG